VELKLSCGEQAQPERQSQKARENRALYVLGSTEETIKETFEKELEYYYWAKAKSSF
jgi:hypothetical protein